MIPLPNQIPPEFITNFYAISNASDGEITTESYSEQVSFQDCTSSNIPNYQSTMQTFPAPLVYNYQTKTWNSFYDNVVYKGFS